MNIKSQITNWIDVKDFFYKLTPIISYKNISNPLNMYKFTGNSNKKLRVFSSNLYKWFYYNLQVSFIRAYEEGNLTNRNRKKVLRKHNKQLNKTKQNLSHIDRTWIFVVHFLVHWIWFFRERKKKKIHGHTESSRCGSFSRPRLWETEESLWWYVSMSLCVCVFLCACVCLFVVLGAMVFFLHVLCLCYGVLLVFLLTMFLDTCTHKFYKKKLQWSGMPENEIWWSSSIFFCFYNCWFVGHWSNFLSFDFFLRNNFLVMIWDFWN